MVRMRQHACVCLPVNGHLGIYSASSSSPGFCNRRPPPPPAPSPGGSDNRCLFLSDWTLETQEQVPADRLASWWGHLLAVSSSGCFFVHSGLISHKGTNPVMGAPPS